MSGERFSGFTQVFGFATGDSMVLTDTQGYEIPNNETVSKKQPPGLIDPAAYVFSNADPEYVFRTQDIDTVMDDLSWTAGKCFDEDSIFYLQQRADCGTFVTGTNHVSRTVKKGFGFVDQITADEGSPDGAILTMNFRPLLVTGETFVANAANVDLAAVTAPAFGTSYFLASPSWNSAEVLGVQSVTASPRVTFQSIRSRPGAFAGLGAITMREAEFIIRGEKINAFDSIPMGGVDISSEFSIYLQKADATNAAGDGRVAVGTSQHIKITATAGRISSNTLSVDGIENAVQEIRVTPTGTVTFSKASAISYS